MYMIGVMIVPYICCIQIYMYVIVVLCFRCPESVICDPRISRVITKSRKPPERPHFTLQALTNTNERYNQTEEHVQSAKTKVSCFHLQICEYQVASVQVYIRLLTTTLTLHGDTDMLMENAIRYLSFVSLCSIVWK